MTNTKTTVATVVVWVRETVFIFSKSIQNRFVLSESEFSIHFIFIILRLMLSEMPEHGLCAVLLDHVHHCPVCDQGDVCPDHVQGEIVSYPDTVTVGLSRQSKKIRSIFLSSGSSPACYIPAPIYLIDKIPIIMTSLKQKIIKMKTIHQSHSHLLDKPPLLTGDALVLL